MLKKESISEATPTLGRVSEAAAISFHSLQSFCVFFVGMKESKSLFRKKDRQALQFRLMKIDLQGGRFFFGGGCFFANVRPLPYWWVFFSSFCFAA